jgi:pimeloyl-ACP methyl ester carboxylesterase
MPSPVSWPTSGPSVIRRTLGAILLALLGVAGVLLGAFAADPLGALRFLGTASLRAHGAHVEYFRAPDGTRLRTFVAGPLSDGRPVVLLHGLGADATYWAETVDALRRAGRTVIVPDAPGSGGSGTPPTAEGFSLPARVAAVEALATALRLDRFDLVGHSLGGATAGLFALAHPERVGKLVLVDASGFSRVTEEQMDDFRQVARPRSRAGARRLMALLFFSDPLPPVGAVVDGLARRFLSPNVQATIEEAGRPDVLVGREGELPRGTVLIWGAKESLFPVSDARSAAARIPDARLVVVPDAGHDVPLERPAEFRRALLAALGAR